MIYEVITVIALGMWSTAMAYACNRCTEIKNKQLKKDVENAIIESEDILKEFMNDIKKEYDKRLLDYQAFKSKMYLEKNKEIRSLTGTLHIHAIEREDDLPISSCLNNSQDREIKEFLDNV